MERYSDKHGAWSTCPRCVSGNMYQDHDGEYVCLQCGYRYYTNEFGKTTSQ